MGKAGVPAVEPLVGDLDANAPRTPLLDAGHAQVDPVEDRRSANLPVLGVLLDGHVDVDGSIRVGCGSHPARLVAARF
jgi:hypothetical protein